MPTQLVLFTQAGAEVIFGSGLLASSSNSIFKASSTQFLGSVYGYIGVQPSQEMIGNLDTSLKIKFIVEATGMGNHLCTSQAKQNLLFMQN